MNDFGFKLMSLRVYCGKSKLIPMCIDVCVLDIVIYMNIYNLWSLDCNELMLQKWGWVQMQMSAINRRMSQVSKDLEH